jgi:hypothetical protein
MKKGPGICRGLSSFRQRWCDVSMPSAHALRGQLPPLVIPGTLTLTVVLSARLPPRAALGPCAGPTRPARHRRDGGGRPGRSRSQTLDSTADLLVDRTAPGYYALEPAFQSIMWCVGGTPAGTRTQARGLGNRCSILLSYRGAGAVAGGGAGAGGDRGTRTPNLCDANAALFQLSYIPIPQRRRATHASEHPSWYHRGVATGQRAPGRGHARCLASPSARLVESGVGSRVRPVSVPA